MVSLASPAFGQDFARYGELSEIANEAFGALDGDSDDEARSSALADAARVIDWIEDFEGSESFAEMSDEDRDTVITDRHRWQYNGARQLLLLDRCVDARDELRSMLDEGIRDAELLPRVSATFAYATECANELPFGVLRLAVTPDSASVLIDGIAVGPASAPHRVEVGEHEATITATGYEDYRAEFTIERPGDEVQLPAIDLVAVQTATAEPIDVVEPSQPPDGNRARSIALIAAGGAAVVTGAGFLVAGSRHRRLADDPPDGTALTDPTRENRVVRNWRIAGAAAITAGGLGCVLGALGLSEDEPAVAVSPAFGEGYAGFVMVLR